MINIICFGNPLCSDDGVGHTIFKDLKEELEDKPEWTEFVQLFYGGNSGQRALPYFMNCSHVIVVDAILDRTRQEPGRIHRLKAEDLTSLDNEEEASELSSHILALPQSWQLLKELRDTLPELTLFAIEIGDATPYCEGLSPEVDSAAHQVMRRIMQLCRELIQD